MASVVNGKISIGEPGIQGRKGERSSYTFFGDSSLNQGITIKKWNPSYETYVDAGYAYLPESMDVKENDTIIYNSFDDKKVYQYNVEEYFLGTAYVKEIDTLENSDTTSTDVSADDINITITAEKMPVSVPMTSNEYFVFANYSNYVYPYYLNVNVDNLISFNVKSNNEQPLKDIRLMLEFTTNFTSPGVYTKIGNKFKDAGVEMEVGSLAGPIKYPVSFRGCVASYSNIKNPSLGYVVKESFDDEHLENFYILLKDFTEHVYETEFTKDVYLIKDAIQESRKYSCRILAFVKTVQGYYEKLYIGEIPMAEILNTEVEANSIE